MLIVVLGNFPALFKCSQRRCERHFELPSSSNEVIDDMEMIKQRFSTIRWSFIYIEDENSFEEEKLQKQRGNAKPRASRDTLVSAPSRYYWYVLHGNQSYSCLFEYWPS